jgi:hypothetical protein
MSVVLSIEEIRRQFRLPEDFPESLIPTHYREIAFGTALPERQEEGRVLSKVLLFWGTETKVLRFIETGDPASPYAYEEQIVTPDRGAMP